MDIFVNTFFTAINCMDGRVQLPVIKYIQEKFNTPYVDMITEPGPILYLSEHTEHQLANSIFDRVDFSISKHNPKGIVITGHYDCLGNPTTEDVQKLQIRKSKAILEYRYPELPIYGLWLDNNFDVHEVG